MKAPPKPPPNMLKVALKRPKYSEKDKYYLVPYEKRPNHPDYVKVGVAPPQPHRTLYNVDRKTHKVSGILTEYSDGLLVAWVYCGRCRYYWQRCICGDGVHCGRSIEYIGDRITAKQKGEEWNYTHPNYRGSLRRALEEERQMALDRRRTAATIVPPPIHHEAPRRLQKGAGDRKQAIPAPTPEPPAPKKLRKAPTTHRQSSSDVVSSTGVDHGRLDKMAGTTAKNLSDLVAKRAQEGMPQKSPRRLKRR